MKLYTEEQMIAFANWCRIHDSYHRNEVWMIGQLLTKYENTEILSKPIELPTDEEIEKEVPFSKSTFGFEQGQYQGFIMGTKWMKDKIRGGNK